MLGSWFPHKPHRKKLLDVLASDEAITKPPLAGEDAPNTFRSLTAKLTTPHDSVLADLYGQPSDTVESSKSHIETAKFDFHNHNSTLASTAASQSVSGPETVHDPFDGSALGILILPDPNLHPEAHAPLSDAANKNEELWSHLSSVLDLQNQIAAFHLDMEGIGSRSDGKGKAKGKANSRKPINSSNRPVPPRSATTRLDDPEYVGEDEGVGVGAEDDEEERKDRELEEEFTRLADQFEGRKEGINEIMSKLDDLSKALTKFHALQAPQIHFPSSKHNSLSVTASPSSPVDPQRAIPRPLAVLPASSLSRNSSADISSSTGILSPSRMLESPLSADSHGLP